MNVVEIAISVFCLVVAVAAVVSGGYIAWVYRERHEDALFLTRLVYRDIRVAIGSAVILVYIVAALLGLSPGRPWGALVIGLIVSVFMYGVVSDALLWRRERRK